MGLCWKGYEIHLGRTIFNTTPEETLVKKDETLAVIDRRKKVIGTYIHGWFESKEVSERLFSLLTGKDFKIPKTFSEIKNREMDELAIFIEKHCDVEQILKS